VSDVVRPGHLFHASTMVFLRSHAASGDRRAEFEQTALPYMNALYGMAHRLTQRPEDASDLVQETFLRAYRTFDGFTAGTNAKAWLFTILCSIFANRYRKERRTPPEVPLHELEERLGSPGDGSESPLADGLPAAEEVERALGDLPESFRVAVVLVDVEELSYAEAAAALGCPVGTLRSRLFRGRRLLYGLLHEYARRAGLLRQV
jgi:RNA polymerase sigma-70 factor (ECF subfamily)